MPAVPGRMQGDRPVAPPKHALESHSRGLWDTGRFCKVKRGDAVTAASFCSEERAVGPLHDVKPGFVGGCLIEAANSTTHGDDFKRMKVMGNSLFRQSINQTLAQY